MFQEQVLDNPMCKVVVGSVISHGESSLSDAQL